MSMIEKAARAISRVRDGSEEMWPFYTESTRACIAAIEKDAPPAIAEWLREQING